MRWLCAMVVVFAAGPAAAVEVETLGPSRAISHSSSASRDTGILGVVVVPRPILSGGGDFALVSIRMPSFTLRLGAFGMLELESEGETDSYFPRPAADTRFWRGLWGYAAALSFDGLAERWCGGCALEAALTWRHESEHYTGSNDGDRGTDYSAVPHIGDFIMADVAARRGFGAVELTARAQHKYFIHGNGGYSQGPGGDLVVRWRRWPRVHPFASAFGEYLYGTDGTPDAYLARAFIGVILPSRHGDLYVFAIGDVGHRKGLAVFTEEATVGFGLRFAFW